MSMKMKLGKSKLPLDKLADDARKVGRYRAIIFAVAVVLIYGFVILQINNFNNIQPSADAVSAQNNPIRTAHIDKTDIQQLQSLQDNSVSVKTLFDQARNNPFE